MLGAKDGGLERSDSSSSSSSNNNNNNNNNNTTKLSNYVLLPYTA